MAKPGFSDSVDLVQELRLAAPFQSTGTKGSYASHESHAGAWAAAAERRPQREAVQNRERFARVSHLQKMVGCDWSDIYHF
jgi:hypothetical protein